MLSKSAEDALRAVHFLAHLRSGVPVTAGRIAGALDLPANSLSKLLHRLQRAGLLESHRGPTGGFTLSRAPESITLAEVVAPFDDLVRERHCLLGRPACRDEDPCAAHGGWREVQDTVIGFFRGTTLADLGPPSELPVATRTPGGRS